MCKVLESSSALYREGRWGESFSRPLEAFSLNVTVVCQARQYPRRTNSCRSRVGSYEIDSPCVRDVFSLLSGGGVRT